MRSALDRRTIPTAIRTKLEAAGHALQSDAKVRVDSQGSRWRILDSTVDELNEPLQIRFVILDLEDTTGEWLEARPQIADSRSASIQLPIQLLMDQTTHDDFIGRLFIVASYIEDGVTADDNANKAKLDTVAGQLDAAHHFSDLPAELQTEFQTGFENKSATVDVTNAVVKATTAGTKWHVASKPPLYLERVSLGQADGPNLDGILVYYDRTKDEVTQHALDVLAQGGLGSNTPGVELPAYLDRFSREELLAFMEHLRTPYRAMNAFFLQHATEAIGRKQHSHVVISDDAAATPLALDTVLDGNENDDYDASSFSFAFNMKWSEVRASSTHSTTFTTDPFEDPNQLLTKTLKLTGVGICDDQDPESPSVDVNDLRDSEQKGRAKYFSNQGGKDGWPTVIQPSADCADFAKALDKIKELQAEGKTPPEIKAALDAIASSTAGKSLLTEITDVYDGLSFAKGLASPVFESELLSKLFNAADVAELFLKGDFTAESWVTVYLSDFAGEAAGMTMTAITVPMYLYSHVMSVWDEADQNDKDMGELTAFRWWCYQLDDLASSGPLPEHVSIDLGADQDAAMNAYWHVYLRDRGEGIHPGFEPTMSAQWVESPPDLTAGYLKGVAIMDRVGPELVANADRYISDSIDRLPNRPVQAEAPARRGVHRLRPATRTHREQDRRGAPRQASQGAGAGRMSAFTQVYFALLDFVEPLRRRLETPEAVEYLMYRYGWSASLDDAGLASFRQVATVIAPLESFVTQAEAARGKDELSNEEIATLVASASNLVRALSAFSPASTAGLADPFGRAELWESVAEAIFDDLLEEYLRVYHPAIFLVLRAWGVIRYDATTPTTAGRKPYTRTWFDWSRASAAVGDPLGALKQVYHWGDPTQPFAHHEALDMLRQILIAVRVPTRWIAPALMRTPPFAPDPDHGIADDMAAVRAIVFERDLPDQNAFFRIGFEVFPASGPTDTHPTGLMLRPLLEGGADKTLPLSKRIGFKMHVGAGLGDSVGVAVFPDRVKLVGGEPALGTKLELLTTGSDPWFIVGDPKGTRFEIGGFSLSAELGGATLADPEVTLKLSATGAPSTTGAATDGCTIVVSLADADPFVRGVAPSGQLKITCTPAVAWSSKTGFAFSGAPTLDLALPVAASIGPVTISNVHVSIKPANGGLETRAGLALSGKLGPLTVTMDGLGLAVDVTPHERADIQALPPGQRTPALGSLDVDTHFATPDGIGLAIDVAGVASGGGFLGHTDGQYSGELQLSVLGVAVKAFGLIETGDAGYSAIVVLSAEWPHGLPLGWGFTLDGVGGMAGIGRTVSLPNVEAAIWSGHFADFLFPANPAAAAPALLRSLDSYFPAAPGRYVFGPLAKIGWGDGIVEATVGLLVEVPAPVKILLVGEIDVAMPPAAPQLELHVNFAGGVDFGQELAFFDASLHDSKLAGFPISGDLAFRYGWGASPVFALSVGGFHPSYQPPAGFPALRRITIAIGHTGVQITAQGYIALTSNTAQLGGHVELTAGTSALNVHGFLGFDALVQWDPFAFTFDLSAGVDLRSGTTILASVHLDGTVSGTSPWHVSANASLSLLFFSVSVHVDKKWGDTVAALPAPDPTPQVIAALQDPRAWSSALPAGIRRTVTTRTTDAGVLVDPAGGLHIAQRVAPLGQPITRFGGVPLAHPVTLSIDSPNIAGETRATTTTDEFALAQFNDFTDAEKLSLPSFTRLPAGVEIGASASDVGSGARPRAVPTPATYVTATLDSITPPPPTTYQLSAATQALLHARLSPPETPSLPIAFADETYVIATTSTLVARADLATDGTKLGALRALAAHVAVNPADHGQLQVVLAQEAV